MMDNDNLSLDDTETFPLSEAGNAVLEAVFSKHIDKGHMRIGPEVWNSRFSLFKEPDTVVVANLLKMRMDTKA